MSLEYDSVKDDSHIQQDLSKFWKTQPYQCFAPKLVKSTSGSYTYTEVGLVSGNHNTYIEVGHRYWPPYLLPFVIWGSFLLLVLLIYVILKCFKCCGLCLWSEHLTKWLVFIFAVNGSLWFWITYYLFFQISCAGQHHGGWPRFFSYEDFGYVASLIYFFFVAFIVVILIAITIYDAVTMEEFKMIQKCVVPEDASAYMMELRDSAPRQRVLVEVFHEELRPAPPPRFPLTRQEMLREFYSPPKMIRHKVVTYTEDRDFDYDTWDDPTSYPDINDLLEDNLIAIFRLNISAGPGDNPTQMMLESFKRRLVASCAYRDQRVSERVESILPAMKYTKFVVRKAENVGGFSQFWFSSWGLWVACLLSIGAIVRVVLRSRIRRIALNIKKNYYADPTNARSYDFDASIPGAQAVVISYDGGASNSLIPGTTNSRNPSPSAPTPTHDVKDFCQDNEMQPEYVGEKPPPSYEDAIS